MKNHAAPRTVELTTPFEDALCGEVPFYEYPRPQMAREAYICLNGKWSFAIESDGSEKFKGEITVPYPPESRLSGVGRAIDRNDTMVYCRSFDIPDGFNRGRILLHLDAVDQTCSVYVNGVHVGDGVGGYLPLTFDVTDAVTSGWNTVTVRARDPMDTELPYGKQTEKRGGMWYTKVSGIWQTVWLESVPKEYVTSLKLTPSLHSIKLRINGGADEKLVKIMSPDGETEHVFTGDEYTIRIDSPRLWTPEDPYLYYFTLKCGDDVIKSYFALRTFTVTEVSGKAYLSLNGKPYFLHGLLDQGYFSDGIFLPASPAGFENDILQMKSCGFNMLRKHIKLEPDLFYYYCDKHGMIVCQDMINSGHYSFIIDTALPTVGLRRGISHRASEFRKAEFMRTSKGIIDHLYNHPSVCCYTIFNEGWGQFDAEGCYKTLKPCDTTRVYDTTSGWFKTDETDVESDHVYFKPVKLKNVPGKPMVLSEFGGYSCKIEGHSFNLDKAYGYRFFDNISDFEDALVSLYENEIIPHILKGLSAAVLTQVSDVEDETNGLLTYDRRVLKVNPERMRAVADKLYSAFYEEACK